MNERNTEATFAPEQIGWIDFESRGRADLKEVGTYAYATQADAIICAYAIGDGPVQTFRGYREGEAIGWEQAPLDFLKHHAKVMTGSAVWAAWNAGFDRAIWNYATEGWPELEPHHIIDVMAQAAAAGLPPDLEMAAKMSHSTHKLASGKHLIELFCMPDSFPKAPLHRQPEWAEFIEYAKGDITAMRDVFKGTLQLSLAEWREYWAMEAINSRGVCIDVKLAERAAELAAEDKVRSRGELARLTSGTIASVDHVKRMIGWLMVRLPAEGRAILTKREEEIDEETGQVTKPAKHSLTRRQVEHLIAYVEAHPEVSPDVLQLLQIRLYGGSKTPAKFAKMLKQQVDGVLYGQYVFNGAAQTGRASSKGVQIHNLARAVLDNEPDVIEAITFGTIKYDELNGLGDATPVSRKLSLLIRPTFVPGPGKVFVWSDWSQIEARVLPWLCDHYEGARQRLDIFRAVDADPSVPDLYTRAAADISHIAIADVTKAIRQRGKVAELALGFCGGVNALQNMAASYGMHISDAEGREVVDRWRAANPWAMDFSRELWNAMLQAIDRDNHGKAFRAGRVWFRFLPDYLNGTLLIRLPSGRRLTYRGLRWDDVDVLDDDGNKTGEKSLEMMFYRGYGRLKIWPGMFVENITQATAADFLRGALARLHKRDAPVRLHTHDEILIEVDEHDAQLAAALLKDVMRCSFDWSDGLPLMSEETIAYYYTKHEGSHGT